jgi:hypothetical protein
MNPKPCNHKPWPQALPLGLSHLHLSACERLTGAGLCRLSRLRSLRLSGCPAVTETAVQVRAHLLLVTAHDAMHYVLFRGKQPRKV